MPTVTYSKIPLIEREDLATEENAVYSIPLTEFRTWDAMATNLPGTAANDDLALITGSLGTDSLTIEAGDIGGTSSTRYAACQFALKPEYKAGGAVSIRASAGVQTTVADGSCTVDFQVYKVGRDTTVGSDICATAATTCNSTSFSDKTFTITPTSLSPGDVLYIRMALIYADTGDAGVMIPTVAAVEVLASIRG